jgi:type I restriction enzyme M protein
LTEKRNPNGRWRAFPYKDFINRDKASLDTFWLKDESLEDADNRPPPELLAQQVVKALEAALKQFRGLAEDLGGAENSI